MTTSLNIPVYSDALVVLGTAGIIVPLVQRWGLNPVIGYLVAGAVLGPLGLGTFIKDIPLLYWFTVVDIGHVSGIADLGVVFLLFLIGLELSYDRLMAMRRWVVGLGGAQILVSTLGIAGVAIWAGQRTSVALVIGACLALSSTAIVLEVLAKDGRLKTAAGRASFAVLLAQDVAVIPILIFISILGTKPEANIVVTVTRALLQASLAIAVIVIVGRLFLRPLFRLVASTQSSELFVAALLFVIVATGVLAGSAGMSMALGAFVAGLLLAETEYRKAIEGAIGPFKGLLLGIFFFTVGMGIDVRVLANNPFWLMAGVIGLIGLKTMILIAAGYVFKLPWVAAIEAGLLLGPGGEFAFVGIGLAGALGLLSQHIVSFALALVSLSMLLIPLLGSVTRRLAERLQPRADLALGPTPYPTPKGRHAIVVGYGRVGRVVCSLLKEHGVQYIATDYDPLLVSEERARGKEVFYGDATKPDFLRACGIMEATGLIITIQEKTVTSAIVEQVRQLRSDVLIVARARDAEHARQLYAVGVNDAVPETIEASLLLSEAALVGLGVAMDEVITSIRAERDRIRGGLRQGAGSNGSLWNRQSQPSVGKHNDMSE